MSKQTWCRFDDGDRPRYGLVEDEVVYPVTGSPLTSWRRVPHRTTLSLRDISFLPPVIPSTFFCVGLNYKAHAERAAHSGHAHAVPQRPEVGYRANNALIGHREPIVRPADYPQPLEAEGELVAVIGREVRGATAAQARAAVLGWTIGNDVTARDWQRADRTFWRSKNSDTFKPMGPFLVTGIGDEPLAATTTVRVDGAAAAEFPTGAMLFDPYELIAATSRYITLSPGDVLWCGTDETVQFSPGQSVEVSIDGLGTLSNPAIEEEPR